MQTVSLLRPPPLNGAHHDDTGLAPASREGVGLAPMHISATVTGHERMAAELAGNGDDGAMLGVTCEPQVADGTFCHLIHIGPLSCPVDDAVICFDGPALIPHLPDPPDALSPTTEDAFSTTTDAEPMPPSLEGPDDVTEWRVLCAVLGYQMQTRYNTLWVARDESLASFLERAYIILLPADASLSMSLIDPSPCSGMLTFVVYPAWWSHADFTTFLLAWPEDETPPFVEIGRSTNVLADFLPVRREGREEHVDVFTTTDLQPQGVDEVFCPPTGSLVLVRPPSVDEPTVHQAQHIINDYRLAFPVGAQYPPPVDGSRVTLLLGVGFEQLLVRHVEGARHAELAAAYQIAEDEAEFYHAVAPFERTAVRGATADGLVAIRDKRVSVGSANGGGVFFDPRDVGRPICFRLLPTKTMPADALLGLLDLTLPPGLILIIEGPEVMPGGRSFRVPLSVTSVSVFAAPINPPSVRGMHDSASDESGNGGDDGDVTEDAADEDAHSVSGEEVGGGGDREGAGRCSTRSRSPRRHACHLSVTDGAQVKACRPIPTPVRALKDDDCPVVCADMVPTVLDACRCATLCALMNARREKKVISLAQAVGPQVFAIDEAVVWLQEHADDVLRLGEPWQGFLLMTNAKDYQLHASTRHALDHCATALSAGSLHEHRCLSLYVDGSAKNDRAAWAFAALQSVPHSEHCELLGFSYGELRPRDDDGHSIGENEPTALQAEQCAICWCLLWLLQHIASEECPPSCAVYFDCTAAGRGADGAHMGPQGSPLTAVARGIVHVFEAAGFLLSWHHVSSHQGHPWNELVDVLAKTVIGVLPRPENAAIMPPVEVASRVRRIDWDWAWLCAGASPSASYPKCSHGVIRWDSEGLPSELRAHHLVPTTVGATDCGPRSTLMLRVYTLNVQSLKGKHKLIEEQAEAHNIDVLCLQETHTNEDYVETSRYHRFASQADQHYGTAVWVRKHIVIDNECVPVTAANVHQLIARPKFIAVLLRIGSLSALLGSVYLPQQARGREEREAVLDDVSRVLRAHDDVGLVTLGADANARLECHCHGVTGGLVFDEPDDCGRDLAAFLGMHRLYVPTTYTDVHFGPSGTWQHAKGQQSRIDYMFIRAARALVHESTWVSHTLDAFTSNDDHRAVAWRAEVVVADVVLEGCRLYRPKYDRTKILSKEGRELLAGALRGFQHPDWALHPDDHAERIAEFLRNVLEEHFLLPAHQPHAQYISAEIWERRNQCMLFKKRTRHRHEGFWGLLLEVSFSCWRKRVLFPDELRKRLLLHEVNAAAVKYGIGEVKHAIRNSKRDGMRAFLQSLGGLKLHDLQKALRAYGIGGKRGRKARRPAPRLKDEAGCAVVGRAALDRAWLAFFGAMEGGEVQCVEAFTAANQQRDRAAVHAPD